MSVLVKRDEKKNLRTEKDYVFVDMDGVLADLLTPWLAMYNRDFSDNLKPGDITDYRTYRFVKPECGEEGLRRYFETGELFRNLPPMPKAISGVRALVEMGYKVYIATSPPSNVLGVLVEKMGWIGEHLPEFKKRVVFVKNKRVLRRDGVLIDDAPSQLAIYTGLSLCFAHPYNEGSGDYRVQGWQEVLDFFGWEGELK